MKKYLLTCLVAVLSVSTLSSFSGLPEKNQPAVVSVMHFAVPDAPVFSYANYNRKGRTLVGVGLVPGATGYNWYLNGKFLYTTTNNYTSVGINCGSYGAIGVEAVNASGVSALTVKGVVGCSQED